MTATALAARPDFHLRTEYSKTHQKTYGKASALLRMIGTPAVTFLMTTRCNLTCDHCFVPAGTPRKDLDLELAKAVADELDPYHKLYLSGGEPLFPFSRPISDQQKFMDFVYYLSARTNTLSIVTNGSHLPNSLDGAVSFINEFPDNVAFILSADPFHAKAMAKIGKSLAKIFERFYKACQVSGHSFYINHRWSFPEIVRNPHGSYLIDLLGTYSIDFLEIGEVPALDNQTPPLAFCNAVYAQGKGRDLPKSETKLVSLANFVHHTHQAQGTGLFITPSELVIGGDHAAYLPAPPSFAVLGDLRQETFAKILWRKLLPGYYTGHRFFPSAKEYLRKTSAKNGFEYPFSDENFQAVAQRLFLKRDRQVPLESLISMLKDPSIPIDWEIDLEPAEDRLKIINSLEAKVLCT